LSRKVAFENCLNLSSLIAMKPAELIRIFVFVVLGAVFLFFLQPLLYQQGISGFYIADQDVDEWLTYTYHPAARFVFIVALMSTLAWFGLTANNKAADAKGIANWKVVWWVLFAADILITLTVIYFFNIRDNALAPSSDALVSLTGCFIFNVLWLFWLPTVTSSPGAVKYKPPGAGLIRRLIDSGV
jgi:hypothetical protein